MSTSSCHLLEHCSVLAVTVMVATGWHSSSPFFKVLQPVSELVGYGVSGGDTKSGLSTRAEVKLLLMNNHSSNTEVEND